jgi:hypothetical protein
VRWIGVCTCACGTAAKGCSLHEVAGSTLRGREQGMCACVRGWCARYPKAAWRVACCAQSVVWQFGGVVQSDACDWHTYTPPWYCMFEVAKGLPTAHVSTVTCQSSGTTPTTSCIDAAPVRTHVSFEFTFCTPCCRRLKDAVAVAVHPGRVHRVRSFAWREAEAKVPRSHPADRGGHGSVCTHGQRWLSQASTQSSFGGIPLSYSLDHWLRTSS